MGLRLFLLLPAMSTPNAWHSFSPLLHLNDPAAVWEDTPSFLIAEILFIVLLVWCTWHACTSGGKDRTLFISCLTAGGSIEILTIMHTQVGNFYHSQATIMLFGKREPLYMLLGCYIWFQFCAIKLAQQMKLPALAEASMAALLGRYLWACLDVVGLKFLWWTWHNGEPLYDDRHNGVPVASTFWATATIGALAYIFNTTWPTLSSWLGDLQPWSPVNAVKTLVLGCFLGPLASVGLMNAPFMVLYHPLVTWKGYSAMTAMSAFEGLCIIIIVIALVVPVNGNSMRLMDVRPGGGKDALHLFLQVLLLVATMGGVIMYFDPADNVRTSFGQPFGHDCDLLEGSLWGGFQRKKYVCRESASQAQRLRDNYDVACSLARSDLGPRAVEPELEGQEWYSVCGVPFPPGWMSAMGTNFGFVVMLVYVSLFVGLEPAPALKQD